MATASQLKDDFLTCSICYEVFRHPATLACQHTFCQDCLRNYLVTRTEAVTHKTIPCPTCRQETPVPHPDRPVEDWVGQLKPGLLLTGLMDSVMQGVDNRSGSKERMTTEGSACCSVCKEEGKTTPATSWCSQCAASFCGGCLELHSKMPNSKHHKVVIDLDSNSQRDVDPSHQTEAKTQLLNLQESLAEKIYLTNIVIKECHTQEEKLLKERSHLESDIRTAIKDTIDALAEKEDQLVKKVNNQTDLEKEQLSSLLKTKEDEQLKYQQQQEIIQHALENKDKVDLAEIYRSLARFEAEEDVKETQNEVKVDVSFVYDLDKLKKEIKKLDVKIDVKIVHHYSDVTDPSARPVLHEVLDAKMDRKDVCNVRDVVVMETGGVKATVVIDSSENRLKSFHRRRGQLCSSVLKVTDWPSCVTVIKEGEVAVSVPHCKGILRVAVTPELKLLSKIKTAKEYLSLSALDESTLIARSVESPIIDVVSMNGNILKTYTTLETIGRNVSNPRCLHVTKLGYILVSDTGLKSVICLTKNGDIVFLYTPAGDRPLNNPYGVTSSNTGDIFVVDYSKYKVVHLSSTGEFVRDVLTAKDGLNFPMGICVDDDQLCVTVADKGLYKYKFVK